MSVRGAGSLLGHVAAPLRWLDERLDDVGSVRAIGLARVLVGPLVLYHLYPFLTRAMDGVIYSDAFYVPWVPWFPEAPREVYVGILALGVAASVTMTVGVYGRASAGVAFAVVAYNMFLSETHFRHNRNYLLVVLLGLTLLRSADHYALVPRRPSGDAPSSTTRSDALSSTTRGRADAPLWALYLLRFGGATPYFASGYSKLIDPDWWSGLVTWDRVVRHRHFAEGRVPAEILDVVASRGFHDVFGKVAILTELFFALFVWFPSTRLAAIYVAVWFHAMIELTAKVQVFSFLAIAALLMWATPRERDRVLELRTDRAGGRLIAALVRALDWLARFEVRERAGEGPTVRLVDRGGSVYDGGLAVRLVLSRLPVSSWFVLPTLLVHGARRLVATLATRGAVR